jgi:hypothetical protein
MINQFDELTKSLAQSVTRRAALKKFGVGLAGLALACFGLANRGHAATYQGHCRVIQDLWGRWHYDGYCLDLNACFAGASAGCPMGQEAKGRVTWGPCGVYKHQSRCSFTL